MFAELVGGDAGGDQVAKFVVNRDELEDAGATAVAGVVTALAAPAVKELLVLAELVWPEVQLHEHFLAGLELGAAIVANLAHQPLSQDAFERGRDQERLD